MARYNTTDKYVSQLAAGLIDVALNGDEIEDRWRGGWTYVMKRINRWNQWEVSLEDYQLRSWVGGFVDDDFEAFWDGDEKRLRRELQRLAPRLDERGVHVQYTRPMYGPFVKITDELREALS